MNFYQTQTYIVISKGKTIFLSQDVDYIKVKVFPITSENATIHTILFPYSSLVIDIREGELIDIEPSDFYWNSQGYFIPLQKNSKFQSYEKEYSQKETTITKKLSITDFKDMNSPVKLPSQIYYIKTIQELPDKSEISIVCKIEPFPAETAEKDTPSYILVFNRQCKEVKINVGEIVEIKENHFYRNKMGYFKPNKNFKKFVSQNIHTSDNLLDTFIHHGQTMYENKYVNFIKIKKYIRKNHVVQLQEIIVLIPYDKKIPQSILDSKIYIDPKHLKNIKGNVFVADNKLKECLLPYGTLDIHEEHQENKETEKKVHPNLPSNIAYTLPWDNVVFQNGHIVLRSPFASKGGLGKIIKWEECKADFEKIKIAISRIVPNISAKIEYGNIIEVNNIEEIKKRVINLNAKPIKHPKDVVIKEKERIIVKKQASQITLERVRNLPETKSSQYLKYLCRLHIESFPVYYCTETKQTNSGNASPEKAFIFFLKETDSKITIVYENTIESRSSYIFIVNKQSYTTVINRIHQFFSSDIENKREKMAKGEVMFPKHSLYAYYRIIHNTFHQWKVEINSFI